MKAKQLQDILNAKGVELDSADFTDLLSEINEDSNNTVAKVKAKLKADALKDSSENKEENEKEENSKEGEGMNKDMQKMFDMMTELAETVKADKEAKEKEDQAKAFTEKAKNAGLSETLIDILSAKGVTDLEEEELATLANTLPGGTGGDDNEEDVEEEVDTETSELDALLDDYEPNLD